MRGARLWSLLGLIALLATAIVAAGCGGDDDEGDGNDLGLITEGTLFVGADTPYEPFAIGQPPDISGYDIEVLNAIAENLGVEVEYQDTGFQTIFRDVAVGQFDTAAAASTIKRGREEVVDFTDPYYLSATAVLVDEDSDIASFDDLDGTIVGVQDGTVQEELANDEANAGEVRAFPEGTTAIPAVLTGQVDAVLIDEAVGAYAIENEARLEAVDLVDAVPGEDLFGFAVAPDNDALREAMNDALAEIKDDGTLAELYEKYFQAEPPKEVLEGTNELLTDD
jgi:polar amino acid transport system substrate-binding protein